MMGIMPAGDMMTRVSPVAHERENDTVAVADVLEAGVDVAKHDEAESVDFVQQLLQQVQDVSTEIGKVGVSLVPEISPLADEAMELELGNPDEAVKVMAGLGVHVPSMAGSDLSLKIQQVSVATSEQVVPNITERKNSVNVGQVPPNNAYKTNGSAVVSLQRMAEGEVSSLFSQDVAEEVAMETSFADTLLKAADNGGATGAKDSPLVAGSTEREAVIVVQDKRTPEAGVPVELGMGDSNFEESLLEVKEPTANGVRQALNESGNGEIVRRAQIVLNGKDSGEIRLTLRPEHLGTVRIHLNMEDGRVLGRILVADTMVKAAFDDNMSDLRDSFLKHGLKGELDVSVGDNRSGDSSEDAKNWAKGAGFVSDRVRAEGNDEEQQEVTGALGTGELYLQA